MRSAGLEPRARVLEIDAAANLQSAGKSFEGSPGFRFVSGSKHHHVASLQTIPPVKLRVPGRRPVRNKVRPQSLRALSQGAAHDLLHFPFVQVNAGTKHPGKIKRAGKRYKALSPASWNLKTD